MIQENFYEKSLKNIQHNLLRKENTKLDKNINKIKAFTVIQNLINTKKLIGLKLT